MKKTISATSIATYELCPMQYYFKYVLELLQPFSQALATWIKVHKLIEDYDNWLDIEDDWSEEYKMFLTYKNNPIEWTRICNEKIFNIDLKEWFKLSWKIDRIDDDKIIDFKTTSKDYKQEDIIKIQSLLYAYEEYLETKVIKEIMFYVINKKKYHKKWYKPQVLFHKYSEKDMEIAKEKIDSFIEELKKDTYEAKPWQHCWYCPFWPSKWATKNCQQEYEWTKRWDTFEIQEWSSNV